MAQPQHHVTRPFYPMTTPSSTSNANGAVSGGGAMQHLQNHSGAYGGTTTNSPTMPSYNANSAYNPMYGQYSNQVAAGAVGGGGGVYPGYNPQGIASAVPMTNTALAMPGSNNVINSNNSNHMMMHHHNSNTLSPNAPFHSTPGTNTSIPTAAAAATAPTSSGGLIRLTLRKPMGIVFEPMPAPPSEQQSNNNNSKHKKSNSNNKGTGVRICDLPRTGAASLSRKLEVGDELLSINDVTMSRLTFDEIMDFIIAADPENVNLLFRRCAATTTTTATSATNKNVGGNIGLIHSHGTSSSMGTSYGGNTTGDAGSSVPTTTNNNNNNTATVTWVDERAQSTSAIPIPSSSTGPNGGTSSANKRRGNKRDGSNRKGGTSSFNNAKNGNSKRRNGTTTNTTTGSFGNGKGRNDRLASESSFLDMLIDNICSFNQHVDSNTTSNNNNAMKKKKNGRYNDEDESRYSDDYDYDDDEYSQSQFSQSIYDEEDEEDGDTYASESQYDPSVVSEDYYGNKRGGAGARGKNRRGNTNSKTNNTERNRGGGGNNKTTNNNNATDDESYTIDETVEDDYTLETLDTTEREDVNKKRSGGKGGRGRTDNEYNRQDPRTSMAASEDVPSNQRKPQQQQQQSTTNMVGKGGNLNTRNNGQNDAMAYVQQRGGKFSSSLGPHADNKLIQSSHNMVIGGNNGGGGGGGGMDMMGNNNSQVHNFDNSTGPPNNLPFTELNLLDDNGDGGDVSVLTNNLSQYGGPFAGSSQQHVSPAALVHAHNYIPESGKTLEQSIEDNPERFYRHVVRELLSQHEPEKVRLLEKLLAKYSGREEHLVQKLSLRYRENGGKGPVLGGVGEDKQSFHDGFDHHHQPTGTGTGFKNVGSGGGTGEWGNAAPPTIDEDRSFEEDHGNKIDQKQKMPLKEAIPTTKATTTTATTTPEKSKGITNFNGTYESFKSSHLSPEDAGGGLNHVEEDDDEDEFEMANTTRDEDNHAKISQQEQQQPQQQQQQPRGRQASTQRERGSSNKGGRRRSRSATRGGTLVLSVSRTNSYGSEAEEEGFKEQDKFVEKTGFEKNDFKNTNGRADFFGDTTNTAAAIKNAGASKAPEEETIEVYQTDNEFSNDEGDGASDSFTDDNDGSDYTESDIDGTSPAVIAQVSELLNFVYGKTSVPGQIDRVSTIMRAYEGRENVLLELLETKALIKANSVNEQPPPPTAAAMAGVKGGIGTNSDGRVRPIGSRVDTGAGAVDHRDNDDMSSVSGMSSKFNVKVPMESDTVSPMVSPITQSVAQDVSSPNKFTEFSSNQKENMQLDNAQQIHRAGSKSSQRSAADESTTGGKKKKGFIKKLFGATKKGKNKKGGDDNSFRGKRGSLHSMADSESEI